jgi:hypothetical protein
LGIIQCDPAKPKLLIARRCVSHQVTILSRDAYENAHIIMLQLFRWQIILKRFGGL